MQANALCPPRCRGTCLYVGYYLDACWRVVRSAGSIHKVKHAWTKGKRYLFLLPLHACPHPKRTPDWKGCTRLPYQAQGRQGISAWTTQSHKKSISDTSTTKTEDAKWWTRQDCQ